MRVSELIAQLAAVLAEEGDVEVVVTEWAGARRFPANVVRYDERNEYGNLAREVYIGTTAEPMYRSANIDWNRST